MLWILTLNSVIEVLTALAALNCKTETSLLIKKSFSINNTLFRKQQIEN